MDSSPGIERHRLFPSGQPSPGGYLSPQASFGTPSPCQIGRHHKRFSEAERAAFGNRPFIRRRERSGSLGAAPPADAIQHFSGRPPQASSGSCSVADPASLRCRSSPSSTEPSSVGLEHDRVQAAIERLLPAPGAQSCQESPISPAVPSASPPAQRFPRAVLEQYRTRLLTHCKSLHDARVQLQRHTSDDWLMGPRELRVALTRLDGGDCDEFFLAVGMHWADKGLTLTEFFRALVSSCPEAPLWELRCRLLSLGMWPLPVSKAERLLVRCLFERPDKRNLVNTVAAAKVVPPRWSEEGALSPSLTREEWMKLAEILDLTSFEAKQLYRFLMRPSGAMDLRPVLEAVQATVSPQMTLFRLARNVQERHGTMRTAFAFACKEGSKMRWESFLRLVADSCTDVDERSAARLWQLLVRDFDDIMESCGGEGENDLPEAFMLPADTEDDPSAYVNEDAFARRLIQWRSDDGVFEALREEFIACCGGLMEGRKAMRDHGLTGSSALSPRRLQRCFREIGVKNSDADAIMHAFRDMAGGPTVDDLVEQMRSARKVATSGASARRQSCHAAVQPTQVVAATPFSDTTKLVNLEEHGARSVQKSSRWDAVRRAVSEPRSSMEALGVHRDGAVVAPALTAATGKSQRSSAVFKRCGSRPAGSPPPLPSSRTLTPSPTSHLIREESAKSPGVEATAILERGTPARCSTSSQSTLLPRRVRSFSRENNCVGDQTRLRPKLHGEQGPGIKTY